MNPLIFFILWVFVTEVRSKKALLINSKLWDLEDAWHNDTISPDDCFYSGTYKYFAACPASSPLEQQFNKDVSLTKQSVFSRSTLWRNKSLEDSDVDFCENSYEPAMIYNSRTGEYEIGYELYFIRSEAVDGYIYKNSDFHYYKTVNTKKLPYKIENQTIFNGTSEFVIRYEDDYAIMFKFNNGYRTLGFRWINVLSIKCSKNNKHITVWLGYRYRPKRFENVNDECKNYRPADEALYSKKNQKESLKDILVPSFSFEGNPDLSCGQPYGCLTPSQIFPLWYFASSSARLASCSYSNIIPVWKSIADGNLKRVDLFVAAIIKKSNYNEVIFGVNGVLEMMVPGGSRKMYLSDTKRDVVVEIPKIIYRIIKFEELNSKHIAVIVIHNDPSVIRDTDKLCDKNDTLIDTWETIINDNPKTGSTYICPMTTDLEKKLDVNYCGVNKLNLSNVPREGWSGELWYSDKKEIINSSFERFLKGSPATLIKT